MKKINLLLMSLVALFMACFTACESKYDVDHTAHIVGTWTYIGPNYAEVLVIKEDGSVLSTGVEDGEYWENVAGTIKIKDNVATMTFEDGDNAIGHIDVVPGIAFSIYEEDGEEWTFNYCANDLSDEIIGMWICNDGLPGEENDMAIITYSENGKMTITTQASDVILDNFVKQESDYKVVGNLLFRLLPKDNVPEGIPPYVVSRLIYTPNGTSMGDILTEQQFANSENGIVEISPSFLRVKEGLNLAGNKYDYIKTFVTNVKGLDKDINFMGFEFNFAKMDGVKLDKMLKTILFAVEFPTADSIKYSCHYNGEYMALTAPIAVDGNKMTVKMSEKNAAYKDIDLYTFQDADCSQMHMYMPTYAFINFFGNMQATIMAQMGNLDLTDAAAVKAVFDGIDEAVETINVSFVMSKAK